MTRYRFGLFPVRSPLLGESRLFSLPRGTKMFQFPRLPPGPTTGSLPITEAGLPHSGISGSKPARGSPERIVVRHALRRLLAPRHPPVAQSSLTIPLPETCCPAYLPLARPAARSTHFPRGCPLLLPSPACAFLLEAAALVTIVAPRRLSTTILRPLCSFQGSLGRRSGVQAFGVPAGELPLPSACCLLPSGLSRD